MPLLPAPLTPALAALCLTIAPASGQPAGEGVAPQPAAMTTAAIELTALSPEVRLRKLHVVRPDLIPYPLARETFC